MILFTAYRDDFEDEVGLTADIARLSKSQLNRLPAELRALLNGHGG